MNRLRVTLSPVIVLTFIFIVMLLFGSINASAKSPFSGEESEEVTWGANTQVDSQADGTAILGPLGSRAPRIDQSNQYLAMVYQINTTIRLRSTIKSGTGAWIALPPTVGTGAAPSLAFSNNTNVHVVWVSSNNLQILYALCTVSANTASCNNPSVVKSGNQKLESPDITVLSNTLYVAWINSGAGEVQVARKPASGGSWNLNSTTLNANNSSGGTLAITANSGKIHLAYVYNGKLNIRYYRSTNGDTWGNSHIFGTDTSYIEVDHPSIEADGNNVYLAWDSLYTTANGDDGQKPYALMGTLSKDGGLNWDGDPRYITSTNNFGSGGLDDRRRSRNLSGSNPSEEAGLRPSVALNHQNDFAIVWQERPNGSCSEDEGGTIISNGTSELFLASKADPDLTANSTNWWKSVSNVEAESINLYSIDPDMVIDSAGDEHIVYMRSSADPGTTNCRAGGDLNFNTAHTYRVYYRGPYFTVIEPDKILFPIIVKD